MYKTYIIKSLLKSRFYIGSCKDIDKRLERHNLGLVKSSKPYRPWVVIYTEGFNSRSEAYRREIEIKSYKGGFKFKELIKERC